MAESAADHALAPDTSNLWAAPGWRAWFGLVAAPIAWAAQGLLGWFISGAACLEGGMPWGHLPLAASGWLLAAVSVLAIGASLGALRVSTREWRGRADAGLDALHANARPVFMAAAGVLVSAAFMLGTLYAALAQVFLPMCEAMR